MYVYLLFYTGCVRRGRGPEPDQQARAVLPVVPGLWYLTPRTHTHTRHLFLLQVFSGTVSRVLDTLVMYNLMGFISFK